RSGTGIADTSGLGNRRQHQIRIEDRAKLDQKDTISEVRRNLGRDMERQACLPNASRAGQGHQRNIISSQQRADRFNFLVSSDQWRPRFGQRIPEARALLEPTIDLDTPTSREILHGGDPFKTQRDRLSHLRETPDKDPLERTILPVARVAAVTAGSIPSDSIQGSPIPYRASASERDHKRPERRENQVGRSDELIRIACKSPILDPNPFHDSIVHPCTGSRVSPEGRKAVVTTLWVRTWTR